MWRAVGGLACAAALAVPYAPARAASNGMLAAVVRGAGERVITFNPDGTGVRTVWTPPRGDELSEPVWSPNGNRLALVDADADHGARIVVLDVASGQARAVTDHASGQDDQHPGWSPDGARIDFLRSPAPLLDGLTGQRAASVSADGTGLTPLAFGSPTPVADADWSPDATSLAYSAGGVLLIVRVDLGATRTLVGAATAGGVAWAPAMDSIAYEDALGGNLKLIPTAQGDPTDVTAPSDVPDTDPAWSPDGTQLAFVHDQELRIVAARGGTPRTILRGPDSPTAPAWQPCLVGVTVACVSVAPANLPPAPSCQPSSVTTQAGQPIDLPAPPCVDPSGRTLTVIVVKPPDHGTLSGRRYTPASGFTGEDSLLYKASNGASESALTRLTLFVVPRPVPIASPPPPPPRRAPFLSAMAKPRLDRSGRVLLRASCDQDCTLKLRLMVRLRSRTVRGPFVTKSGRTFTLHLRLHKPVRSIKTAWVTGTVRNRTGDTRAVKLPVTLPR